MFRRFHPLHASSAGRAAGFCSLVVTLAIWAGCDAVAGQEHLPGLAPTLDGTLTPDGTVGSVSGASRAANVVPPADVPSLSPPSRDWQPPSDIDVEAHPCVQAAVDISHACMEETFQAVEACTDAIIELFQAGHIDEAHRAAQACIEQVHRRTADCLDVLQKHQETCIDEMLHNGRPLGAIEAVLRACHHAIGLVLHTRRQGVGHVEDVVDHGDVNACTTHIRQIAVERAEQNAQGSLTCVEQIEELLANGHVDLAVELAIQCTGEIRRGSVAAALRVDDAAQQCLRELLHHGADEELVRSVREAYGSSLHLIFGSAGEAIHQIREVLPPVLSDIPVPTQLDP